MKISVYEFTKETPNEVQEAIEDIRMLLNNGKYVARISTVEPTYQGSEGEEVIYNAGPTSVYLFKYVNGGWRYTLMSNGPLP